MRTLPATATALLLLAVGCGASPQTAPSGSPPSSSSASPSAAATQKVVVGYSNVAGDGLPLWAAQENGNPLHVDLQYLAGGGKTMAALLSGQIQISEQGGGEAVGAEVGGADLVAIATTGGVYPFQLEVSKDIQSANDLKGKKIGIASVGGASDVATRVLLQRIGLVPDKDVALIATGDAQTARAALQGGAIQGSLLSPPSTVEVEAMGSHPLFDMAALKLPNAQGVVTVQRSWLTSHRDVAQKYIDELVKASVRLKADKSFGDSVIRKYYKLDDQKAIDTTYQFYTTEVLQTYPHVTAEQFTDTIAQLSEKNENLKGFDVTKIIDDSLVKDAETRGVAVK